LDDPLAQFNHTLPNREGLRSLVGTLNNALGSFALPITILEQVFETYWLQFQLKFDACLAVPSNDGEESIEPKSEKDLLAEILENTRYLQNRVRSLEASIEFGSTESVDSSKNRTNRWKMTSESGLARLIDDISAYRGAGLSNNSIMSKLLADGVAPETAVQALEALEALEARKFSNKLPRPSIGRIAKELLK
jgi:hypothetical protein